MQLFRLQSYQRVNCLEIEQTEKRLDYSWNFRRNALGDIPATLENKREK